MNNTLAVQPDSPIPAAEQAIDAKTLAPILGCNSSTVHRMAAIGVIPSILVGPKEGGRRFFLSEVKKALAARSGRPVSSKGHRARSINGKEGGT